MTNMDITQETPYQSQNIEYQYKNIKSILQSIKRRIDLLRYTTGILLWLACMSALVILWVPIGGIFRLPVWIHIPLTALWIISALYTVYLFVFKEFSKHITIQQIALKIEKLYPKIQDRIIGALQLWSELSENRYGYSREFITSVISEASKSIKNVDKTYLYTNENRKFKHSLFIFFCAIIPLALIAWVFPSTLSSSLDSIVNPMDRVNPEAVLEITSVEPGNYVIPLGESVGIKAVVKGSTPEKVILHHNTGQSKWDEMTLTPVEDENNHYKIDIHNIKENIKYYVSANNAKSPKYEITVMQRPLISSLQLELNYPKYTELSPEILENNSGNIVAPMGTEVTIEISASKDIASAFVVFDSDTQTRLGKTEDKKSTGSFIIQESGKYHISITDTDGYTNADPIKYSINVVADQPPRVSILIPGTDIELGSDLSLPLQIEARDDYGVARLELYYQFMGDDKENSISLDKFEPPQTNIIFDYIWDMSSLELFPEDVISYYVEASDADNISGPNKGRSSIFTIRLPSVYEAYKELEEDQQIEQSEMEDIREQQDNVKEMVDEIIDDLKKEQDMDWTKQKELEKAAELQKQIEERAKNLAEKLKETSEKMEDNPLISPETLEKLQELRQLMDEVATEEMKQIMRKLSEALNNINSSQQKQDLMSASFKQEEFMEKLDRMIDLFKNMQVQQKLEAAANQMEELLRQQTENLEQTEELAKSSKEDPGRAEKSKNLAEREERIKKQTEAVMSDLDNVSEEMKENMPEIADFIKESSNQAKQQDIPNDMQCAISELNSKNPLASAQCQRNAVSKMSKLSNNLQSALQAMKSQDVSEIMDALSNAIRNSLYLSHKHEDIIKSIGNIQGKQENMLESEKQIMDSLAVDELTLSEGAIKVAEKLREASHKSTSVPQELVWSMERVADGFRRSASAMEDKIPSLAEPIQRNTLSTLNRAIESMIESINQINSQSTPMMGMEEYMEQLRQLAQQQSQLNESTQQADSMQRRQGRTPSVEDMLQKLAQEQSLIREATERLASKMDKLKETLGSLQEVSREMEEVKEELENGYVSTNTMEKQRRILTRLLDYEKSMKRQDFSKKREAQSGKEYTVKQPNPVLGKDATGIKKELDDMQSPSAQERWPEQYRELIRMYYKALSGKIRPTGK
ncbi:DUF4175 family protein [Candidatus Poribacteria bacterium]|nr:DUF4175 family protein [Candidatus Poribacteria bacterium]